VKHSCTFFIFADLLVGIGGQFIGETEHHHVQTVRA
jgi:hypothetical protein